MKIRLDLLRGLVCLVAMVLSLSFTGCEEDGIPSVDENMLEILMSGNTPVSYDRINQQIYEKKDGKWVLTDEMTVGLPAPFTILNGQRLFSTMGPVYFAYGDIYYYAWKQYVEQTGSKIRFYQSTPIEVKDGMIYIGKKRLVDLSQSEMTLLNESDVNIGLLKRDTYAVMEPLFDLTNDNRIYSYEDRKTGMIEAVNILHEHFGDKIPRSPEGDFYTYEELMEIIRRY